MINRYSLSSKLSDNKYFFTLIGLVGFFIYLPTYTSLPFGDDLVYIFKHPHMVNAPHPFIFFNYFSEYFRSWPLSFSLLYVLFNIFGHDTFYYRIFNLLLHLVNTILFDRYIENKTRRHRWISLIFFFHPLAVENVFWIFQLKTLLSVCFFLLTLIYLEKIKNSFHTKFYLFSIFFFLLSLLSKSTAILFPLILIFFLKRYNNKSKLLLITPFMLLSFFLGLESLKGVASITPEMKQINSFQERYFREKPDIKVNPKKSLSIRKREKLKENKRKKKKIEVKQKSKIDQYFNLKLYTETGILYIKSVLGIDKILSKLVISSNSLFFYIKSSLGLNYNQIVYSNLNFQHISTFVNSLICFFIIFLLLIRPMFTFKNVFILLSLYLPISGFFYVPYMAYSYVSDHWYYPALPFTLFLLYELFSKISYTSLKKGLFAFVSLILVIQTILFTQRLSDTREYFYNELIYHQGDSQIIYEYIVELEKMSNNYNKALNTSLTLQTMALSKKILIIDNILELSKKTKNLKIYSEFIKKKSLLYFKNKNYLMAKISIENTPKKFRTKEYYFLLNLYELSFNNQNINHLNTLLRMISE